MVRSLLPLLVTALFAVSSLAGCTTSYDAHWNIELMDFGVGTWAEGPPTEPESAVLINDGDTVFRLQSITLDGDAAGAFDIELTSGGELPTDLATGIGVGVTVTFVGEPGVEEFGGEITAALSPPVRGARQRAYLSLPITLTLDCDADDDGDPVAGCGGFDCDDFDPAKASTFEELCNGLDDNCTGEADYPGSEVDVDNDGFLSCEDCLDGDSFSYPGAPERCDGFDNDCDGTPNAEGGETDGDGDGWLSCEDCDDGDPDVGPFECLR